MDHWWVPGCTIGYEHTFVNALADFLAAAARGQVATAGLPRRLADAEGVRRVSPRLREERLSSASAGPAVPTPDAGPTPRPVREAPTLDLAETDSPHPPSNEARDEPPPLDHGRPRGALPPARRAARDGLRRRRAPPGTAVDGKTDDDTTGVTRKHFAALGAELDRLGFARTGVISLDEATNSVSPDPAVRAAGARRLCWALDMAAEMGAELICGPFHSAFKLFSGHPAHRRRARSVRRGPAHGGRARRRPWASPWRSRP